MKRDRVLLAHGGGGSLTRELIETVFLPQLENSLLKPLDDSAVLVMGNSGYAFTTDSYVVTPYMFPGGDIGKLAVPEYILSKPGRLTPEEFEKVKAHPLVGAEILQRVGFDPLVPAIVRAHHERWDGSGYPDGLGGDHIPLGARILSAVDALDALSSDRHYRKALPLHEAMREVALRAGASFDPEVVDLLARRYEELERKVSRQASPCVSLSLNIRVDRAVEPATGFEAVPSHRAFSDEPSAIRVQPLGCD